MFYLLKRPRRLRPLETKTGQFSGRLWPFGDLQTHSSLRPLHKPASGHPDVGQRKQRDELRGVLGKPPVVHFDVTELALDNPKRMLCIYPAVSAQAKLLKHKPQQGFAYPGPGGAAGGCKSQSSHQ